MRAWAVFWVVCTLVGGSMRGGAMEGIEKIDLRLDIRIAQDAPVERVNRTYLQNLVSWQLDQYRVKVVRGEPALPFLSVRIRVKRLLGSARLVEEAGREIEGLFESIVEIEFHQQVTTKQRPGQEFWTATYRRHVTHHSRSREELERHLIRDLERNLMGFIQTFLRANGRR